MSTVESSAASTPQTTLASVADLAGVEAADSTIGQDRATADVAASIPTASADTRTALPATSAIGVTPGLRLAKLTLAGFKSFADRTDFTFDEPITGIVGPNGCGKSNVVDAIKWVLGERSSKSLRGTEMIDVIFAGSSARKPLGMASVTLTFSNPVYSVHAPEPTALPAPDELASIATAAALELASDQLTQGGEASVSDGTTAATADAVPTPIDGETTSPLAEAPEDADRSPMFMPRGSSQRRGLPIDSDTVEVERRLYRDGVSEYLINGRKARLKDIRDLFLDTGVGADAYCIIEQGKVDAMLLASPMERRSIFEEAAGVAKFRLRKADAERKLERTDANLIRAREQLENTERRLRMVKGQAEKARKFKALDEEHRALKMALLLDQYHGVATTLAELAAELRSLESSRAEGQAQVASLESQRQAAELVRHELADSKRRAESELQNARHNEESAIQRGRSAERASESTRRQLEADTLAVGEVETKLTELRSQMDRAADHVAALGEEQALAEVAQNNVAQQRSAVLDKAAEHRSELSRKRVTVANIDRERAGLLAAVEQDQRRASVVADQIARLKQKSEFSARDREQAVARQSELAKAVEATRTKMAELESQLAELSARSGELGGERRALAEKLSDLETTTARADARRATLAEMVASRVGLDDAVRAVLDAKQSARGFESVIGVLADHIDAAREDADMVELALGQHLQSLIIPTIAGSLSPTDLQSLAGEVAFVPLAGRSLDPDRQTQFEAAIADLPIVRPARAIVQPRTVDGGPDHGAIVALLDRLLGRTLIVRDLDSALLLASGPLASFASDDRGVRFVTEAGLIVEPDGRLLAGPHKADGPSASAGPASGQSALGVLSRRAELESLQTQVAELTAARDLLRAQVVAIDSDAAATAQALGEARRQADSTRRQLAGDESRLEQAGRDIDRLTREAKGLADELGSLTQRGEALDAEREALLARADQLKRLLDDEQSSLGLHEAKIAEVQVEADGLGEQLTAARVNITRIAEQLSAARRERQRFEWTIDENTKRLAQLQQAVKGRQSALVEHNATAAESVRLAEEARAAAEALSHTVSQLEEQLRAAVAASSAVGEALVAAREATGGVEQRWHSLEISKREAQIKRENMEERCLDELGTPIGVLYIEYLRIITPPLVDPGHPAQPAGGVIEISSAEEQITADGTADAGSHEAVANAVVIPVDHAEAASLIEELRREIKRLGNVNLDAIDEESQLAGRNEDLAKQVEDLDAASRMLVELIEKLKDASRERFRRTFQTIQEHFAGDSGMFRKLFGGGKAEVKLMPVVRDGVETQETDWLESGIEIIARPPGKQPRSISQLSGGEKSMTAVALLMAIFRSKPSCFCVLDEVDAALDDANVDRFCRVVEEFTNLSTFIVITHHKRTMHQADQLFGVTMQERGVSKRVSVRIDQIGSDGSIKEDTGTGGGKPTSAPTAPVVSAIASPTSRGKGKGSSANQAKGSSKDPKLLAPIGTGNLGKGLSAPQPDEPTGADIKRGLAGMTKKA